MQNAPAAAILGQVSEVPGGRIATSGGSSDTEVNDRTDIPAGTPSQRAVTMTRPAGKWPSTRRNQSSRKPGPDGIAGLRTDSLTHGGDQARRARIPGRLAQQLVLHVAEADLIPGIGEAEGAARARMPERLLRQQRSARCGQHE